MSGSIWNNVPEERYPVVPSAPLYHLMLMALTFDALRAAEIRTIGELVSLSDKELLALPGFGRKSLKDVREELMRGGLELRR